MNKKLSLAALAMALVAVAGTLAITRPTPVRASDHDDGETDTKTRNTNLTDVYAFREGDQDGHTADNSNLIIAVNINPRSLPRQQYFFNQTANYVINIGQATHISSFPSTAFPSGAPNFQLRLTFGAPNSSTGQQAITLTKVPFTGTAPNAVPNFNSVETATLASGNGLTQQDEPGIGDNGTEGTPTSDQLTQTGISTYTLDGQTLTVFAGLRQDPFFFDVTQFFRVRAGLAGLGPVPSPLFRTPTTAVDFTKDYNVLSMVIRAPIAFLQQGNSNINVFDVFATIEQPTQ